ncbi:unnamed protein product [Closterium sp. NIES-64]|nr:unnamed protein product [Closterium sp. NIES-64]
MDPRHGYSQEQLDASSTAIHRTGPGPAEPGPANTRVGNQRRGDKGNQASATSRQRRRVVEARKEAWSAEDREQWREREREEQEWREQEQTRLLELQQQQKRKQTVQKGLGQAKKGLLEKRREVSSKQQKQQKQQLLLLLLEKQRATGGVVPRNRRHIGPAAAASASAASATAAAAAAGSVPALKEGVGDTTAEGSGGYGEHVVGLPTILQGGTDGVCGGVGGDSKEDEDEDEEDNFHFQDESPEADAAAAADDSSCITAGAAAACKRTIQPPASTVQPAYASGSGPISLRELEQGDLYQPPPEHVMRAISTSYTLHAPHSPHNPHSPHAARASQGSSKGLAGPTMPGISSPRDVRNPKGPSPLVHSPSGPCGGGAARAQLALHAAAADAFPKSGSLSRLETAALRARRGAAAAVGTGEGAGSWVGSGPRVRFKGETTAGEAGMRIVAGRGFAAAGDAVSRESGMLGSSEANGNAAGPAAAAAAAATCVGAPSPQPASSSSLHAPGRLEPIPRAQTHDQAAGMQQRGRRDTTAATAGSAVAVVGEGSSMAGLYRAQSSDPASLNTSWLAKEFLRSSTCHTEPKGLAMALMGGSRGLRGGVGGAVGVESGRGTGVGKGRGKGQGKRAGGRLASSAGEGSSGGGGGAAAAAAAAAGTGGGLGGRRAGRQGMVAVVQEEGMEGMVEQGGDSSTSDCDSRGKSGHYGSSSSTNKRASKDCNSSRLQGTARQREQGLYHRDAPVGMDDGGRDSFRSQDGCNDGSFSSRDACKDEGYPPRFSHGSSSSRRRALGKSVSAPKARIDAYPVPQPLSPASVADSMVAVASVGSAASSPSTPAAAMVAAGGVPGALRLGGGVGRIDGGKSLLPSSAAAAAAALPGGGAAGVFAPGVDPGGALLSPTTGAPTAVVTAAAAAMSSRLARAVLEASNSGPLTGRAVSASRALLEAAVSKSLLETGSLPMPMPMPMPIPVSPSSPSSSAPSPSAPSPSARSPSAFSPCAPSPTAMSNSARKPGFRNRARAVGQSAGVAEAVGASKPGGVGRKAAAAAGGAAGEGGVWAGSSREQQMRAGRVVRKAKSAPKPSLHAVALTPPSPPPRQSPSLTQILLAGRQLLANRRVASVPKGTLDAVPVPAPLAPLSPSLTEGPYDGLSPYPRRPGARSPGERIDEDGEWVAEEESRKSVAAEREGRDGWASQHRRSIGRSVSAPKASLNDALVPGPPSLSARGNAGRGGRVVEGEARQQQELESPSFRCASPVGSLGVSPRESFRVSPGVSPGASFGSGRQSPFGGRGRQLLCVEIGEGGVVRVVGGGMGEKGQKSGRKVGCGKKRGGEGEEEDVGDGRSRGGMGQERGDGKDRAGSCDDSEGLSESDSCSYSSDDGTADVAKGAPIAVDRRSSRRSRSRNGDGDGDGDGEGSSSRGGTSESRDSCRGPRAEGAAGAAGVGSGRERRHGAGEKKRVGEKEKDMVIGWAKAREWDPSRMDGGPKVDKKLALAVLLGKPFVPEEGDDDERGIGAKGGRVGSLERGWSLDRRGRGGGGIGGGGRRGEGEMGEGRSCSLEREDGSVGGRVVGSGSGRRGRLVGRLKAVGEDAEEGEGGDDSAGIGESEKGGVREEGGGREEGLGGGREGGRVQRDGRGNKERDEDESGNESENGSGLESGKESEKESEKESAKGSRRRSMERRGAEGNGGMGTQDGNGDGDGERVGRRRRRVQFKEMSSGDRWSFPRSETQDEEDYGVCDDDYNEYEEEDEDEEEEELEGEAFDVVTGSEDSEGYEDEEEDITEEEEMEEKEEEEEIEEKEGAEGEEEERIETDEIGRAVKEGQGQQAAAPKVTREQWLAVVEERRRRLREAGEREGVTQEERNVKCGEGSGGGEEELVVLLEVGKEVVVGRVEKSARESVGGAIGGGASVVGTSVGVRVGKNVVKGIGGRELVRSDDEEDKEEEEEEEKEEKLREEDEESEVQEREELGEGKDVGGAVRDGNSNGCANDAVQFVASEGGEEVQESTVVNGELEDRQDGKEVGDGFGGSRDGDAGVGAAMQAWQQSDVSSEGTDGDGNKVEVIFFRREDGEESEEQVEEECEEDGEDDWSDEEEEQGEVGAEGEEEEDGVGEGTGENRERGEEKVVGDGGAVMEGGETERLEGQSAFNENGQGERISSDASQSTVAAARDGTRGKGVQQDVCVEMCQKSQQGVGEDLSGGRSSGESGGEGSGESSLRQDTLRRRAVERWRRVQQQGGEKAMLAAEGGLRRRSEEGTGGDSSNGEESKGGEGRGGPRMVFGALLKSNTLGTIRRKPPKPMPCTVDGSAAAPAFPSSSSTSSTHSTHSHSSKRPPPNARSLAGTILSSISRSVSMPKNLDLEHASQPHHMQFQLVELQVCCLSHVCSHRTCALIPWSRAPLTRRICWARERVGGCTGACCPCSLFRLITLAPPLAHPSLPQLATGSFDAANLLGEGACGRMYRGVLPLQPRREVAVKVLRRADRTTAPAAAAAAAAAAAPASTAVASGGAGGATGGGRDGAAGAAAGAAAAAAAADTDAGFKWEVERLSRLEHRNLVSLIAVGEGNACFQWFLLAPAVPTSAAPTCAAPTCAAPTPAAPTCAAPTCAAPTPAAPTCAAPTPAAPTCAAPTPAAPTCAAPTPAAPTCAAPTPAAPTSGEGAGVLCDAIQVRVLGCCVTPSKRILVRHYLPLGSLHDHLHGHTQVPAQCLSWEQRVRIALGTARAVRHLHSQRPQVLHGNIRSSNILLTDTFDAKLTDFNCVSLCYGAPSVAPAAAEAAAAAAVAAAAAESHGTCGDVFVAPELLQGEASAASDAYSFGVVLLELLSGRPPVVEGSSTLVHWAQGALKKRHWQDIVDPALLDPLSQQTCPTPPAISASAPAAAPLPDATATAPAAPPAAAASLALPAAHRVASFLSVMRLAATCLDANPLSRPPFEALAHSLQKILKGHLCVREVSEVGMLH